MIEITGQLWDKQLPDKNVIEYLKQYEYEKEQLQIKQEEEEEKFNESMGKVSDDDSITLAN